MGDEDTPEVTREGLFEDLFGKAKEKTGELLGNEHMAEEGRHLQEQAEDPPADEPTDPPRPGNSPARSSARATEQLR